MNKKLHKRRKIMKRSLKKSVSILLSLVVVVSLFIIVPLTADASSITGFFDCTSGSAEGYFFYRNHFCKIEWTGINTQSTSEVQLFEYKDVRVDWIGSNTESTSVVQDIFAVNRRGSTYSTLLLWDATLHAFWNPLEVENLIAGQSSSGYTNYNVLAAGADKNNYKKVCTITCAAANAPVWDWSDDFTACTATFTCADMPSLTKTVNASVSTEGYTATASVTFNNINYTETITIPGFSVNKAGDTYTIRSEEGWNTFCDCLQDNDTYNRFSGKTVLLADDITVTRMAGGSGHDFKGIFDGQGHTLTVAYGTADSPVSDDDKAAPFRNVESGCVIKNLHTQGTIYTSKKYAGGIVGTQYGTVRLENCRSSVTINSMTAGDGTHGGLVGHNGSSTSAKLTIDGCVFDGKILSVGDDPTTNCAGFVGYKGNNVTITNSIYAPKALETDETEPAGNSATFVRNGSAGANCYYTRTLGTPQGKQAHTVTAGENVTLAPSGTAKTYTVSGITAYASGIEYNGNLYAGSEDTVELSLNYTGTPAAGYTVKGYTASAGTLNGTTLTMPAEDVTVTAELDDISYFDEGTGTLTLKGKILNNSGIILPDGINKAAVLHINVDSSGATLPQDSSDLFSAFTNVTSIDLTGADTRNVTNMTNMFFYCQNLTELDLSSFDTSSVSYMNNMFTDCSELKTIYVSEQWSTESVTDSNDMFLYCERLKGGIGTAFDLDYIDKTYAVIDKDGQPGYLTGLFALKLPDHMEIVTEEADKKVGNKYLSGAALTVKPKTGYTASNVKANGIALTADENGIYTITMPDGNVAVTAEFTYADGVGAALAGHSISLEGDIGVNFYMELDPEIAQSETAYMQFTIPDTSPEYQEQTVSIKDVEPVEGGYYVFKCRVAAKDMNSVITAQFLGVNKETTVYTYSVKDYADWLIEHKNDSEAYTKAAPLVEKMLRYGDYAKEYFDETDTLPDLGDVNIDSKFATYTSTVSDDLFDGATLSLKSQTTLSLYFTDTDKLTFTCVDENGAERTVKTVRNGSTQIARIRNIAANELKDSFTVTVKKGETLLGAITYSPMNYCYRALNGGTENENLINAVKALAAYSDAANEYFKAGV